VKVERVRDAAEVHQVLHRTASHQVQGEGGEGERCSRVPPGPPKCGPVWSRSSTGLPLIRFREKVERVRDAAEVHQVLHSVVQSGPGPPQVCLSSGSG